MLELIKKLYHKYKELVNYVIVGGMTTLVSWATYWICETYIFDTQNPIQLQIAVFLRWFAGVVFAYFTNRKYVFESKNKNMVKEAISFTTSRIATLFLDMFVMWIFVTVSGKNEWVGTLISAVLVTLTNYFLSKFIVFRKGKDKNTENK